MCPRGLRGLLSLQPKLLFPLFPLPPPLPPPTLPCRYYLPLNRAVRALDYVRRREVPPRGCVQAVFTHEAFNEVRVCAREEGRPHKLASRTHTHSLTHTPPPHPPAHRTLHPSLTPPAIFHHLPTNLMKHGPHIFPGWQPHLTHSPRVPPSGSARVWVCLVVQVVRLGLQSDTMARVRSERPDETGMLKVSKVCRRVCA